MRAAAARELAFRSLADAPRITGGQGILELKYYRPAPPIFRQLMDDFGLSPQAISKYRIAVGRLELIDGIPGPCTDISALVPPGGFAPERHASNTDRLLR